MKKILIIAFLFVAGNRLFCQNVAELEYFFDTDPGYGEATQVIVSNPQPNVSNFLFSVPVSGISNGFHQFYIRAKDSNGSWGITATRNFFKHDVPVSGNPYIVQRVEYFVDNDPGCGAGQPVSFTPNANVVNLLFTVGVDQFSDGFHKLVVRASDNKGSWSVAFSKPFYKYTYQAPANKTITRIEYFFDADPGFANPGCGQLSFSPSGNLVNLAGEIPVGSLNPGFHTFYIRARDSQGAWSIAHARPFYCGLVPVSQVPNLVYGEYFIDSDPGLGEGEEINFNPAANIINQSFVVPLTGNAPGAHRLFIRYKDANGKWSVPAKRDFFIIPAPPASMPGINYLEYFVDDDPGFGDGNQISGFSTSNHIENLVFPVDLDSYATGFHKLYIRARDVLGNWGQTTVHSFYKNGFIPNTTAQISEIKYFIGQGTELDYNNFTQVANVNPSLHIEYFVFSIPLPTEQFPVGNYKLYALAKDLNGRTTTTAIDSFRVCDNVAIAGFSFTVGSYTAYFTDTSQLASDYSWSFGDGTYSTEANPVHVFPGNGTYNVCLTVSNDCNEDTFCDSVAITYNAPPTGAGFDVVINEDASYVFSFDDFGYDDEEDNAMDHVLVTGLSLSTGDSLHVSGVQVAVNTQVSKEDLNNFIYKPAFEQAGYRGFFKFRLHDGISYSSNEYMASFTVNAINDSATFELDNLFISVIKNSGATTLSNWLKNLDDGDPNEDQNLTASIAVINGTNLFSQYPRLTGTNYSDLEFAVNDNTTGTSLCRLSITDYGYSTGSNTQNIDFTIEIKSFEAQLSANHQQTCTRDEVLFTSTSPTQGVSFAWNFGDGASPQTFVGHTPGPVIYTTAGIKNIKLTISGFSQTDEKTIQISVLEKPDASFLTGAAIFPLGDTVFLYNTSLGGLRYEWDFGDGTPVLVKTNTDQVKHKYLAHDNDTFRITLTVLNGICTDVYSQVVKFINASPPVIGTEDFATEYTVSELKTVKVVASDLFFELANSKFYYKGIAGNQWNVKDVVLTNDSVYETTIQETMGDQVGITYFFDVFNNMGLKRKSNIGYAFLKFPNGLEIPALTPGTSVNNYEIVSVPLSLQDNSVYSVLDELGSYDNTKWRLFHYTPTGLLEFPADFTTFDKGKGYWLIVRNQVTLNTGTGTTHSGSFNGYTISLRQGWTQIGNPYTFNVSWDDILAANPEDTAVIGNLRVYKQGVFENANVLNAFRGGFVFSDVGGVELSIPVKAASVQKSGCILNTMQLTPENWIVNMRLNVKDFSNSNIGFGMHPLASLSKDRFDNMTVPRFFNYLEVNFMHPEFFYPRFATDVVPSANSHSWEFVIETALEEEIAELSWDVDVTNALPLQMKLVDLKNHKVVDMKKLGQYRFIYSGLHPYKILYGDQEYLDSTLVFDQTVLGDCFPNPFAQKTTIPVFIGGKNRKNNKIDLSIYSLDGRKAETLVCGEFKPGYYEFNWQPDNLSTIREGVYFYTLRNYTDGSVITKRLVIMK